MDTTIKHFFTGKTFRQYLNVQLWLLKVCVIVIISGNIIQNIYRLIINGSVFQEIPGQLVPIIIPILVETVPYLIRFYIPLALLVLFCHILINFIIAKYRYPALYFYYSVWINRFYRYIQYHSQQNRSLLKGCASWMKKRWFNTSGENPNRDDLIIDSFPERIHASIPNNVKTDYATFVQLISLGNRPVVVRRQDLMEKSFLPNWAFVSVLYFKPLVILKQTLKRSRKIRLKIDLRNESYGIYNNAGKLFLKLHYLANTAVIPRLIEQSQKLENFIKSDESGEQKFNFSIPFRWASGGILPIAEYRGREWFVLFLRELDPVGLNLANGASEDKAEYKKLYTLMQREFGEELILLNQEPIHSTRTEIQQKVFELPDESDDDRDPHIRNKKFAEEHQQMRNDHDGMLIQPIDGPEIRRIETPFEVEITYDDEKGTFEKRTIKNIFFNINPTEFGIEICQAAKFKMDDDDYILDGEIWNDEFLVRQPVMLLSCDFIKAEYQKNQTIGVPCPAEDCKDCKDCRILDTIPCNDYVLFNADLDLRKVRLEKLMVAGEGDSTEAQKIRRWLERHEKMFADIHEKTNLTVEKHPLLTRLCPVTWKTFEKLCYYRLI